LGALRKCLEVLLSLFRRAQQIIQCWLQLILVYERVLRHVKRGGRSSANTHAINRAFRTMTAIADKGYIYEMVLSAGTFLVD